MAKYFNIYNIFLKLFFKQKYTNSNNSNITNDIFVSHTPKRYTVYHNRGKFANADVKLQKSREKL